MPQRRGRPRPQTPAWGRLRRLAAHHVGMRVGAAAAEHAVHAVVRPVQRRLRAVLHLVCLDLEARHGEDHPPGEDGAVPGDVQVVPIGVFRFVVVC